jgi:putative ABC transport system permease protein
VQHTQRMLVRSTERRPSRVALRYRRPVAETVEVLHNLVRRRLRNVLTVAGITVGVFALTTLGAMAERADSQLSGGERFLSDHVTVQAANQAGTSLINSGEIAQMEAVPGVAAAYPTLTMPADAAPPVLGSTSQIVAYDWGEYDRLDPRLPVADGRELRDGDAGVTVVGSDFASRYSLSVGSRVTLPIPPQGGGQLAAAGRPFRVVGILAPTLTAPDQWAEMSLADAGRLVARNVAPALASQLPTLIANGVDVYGDPGADLDAIARQVQASVDGMQAIGPTQAIRAFQQLGAVYTALTTGSALVALVVGGLSVVNTMLMAVTDRVREIGIKKAVGAPPGRIVIELLLESALLGAAGGVVGLLLGWMVTAFLNMASTASQGASLFLLSPRLVVGVPLFAIVLGVAAGALPAYRAGRLDPVAALRSQE